MKDIVRKISESFLEEAKASPQLLADMAAMEKYMAESYGERIFIELLQNADDASSKKMIIYNKNGHVFVANDGKPFNKTDIESISRSGASTKKRGKSIGYRGVGFKSASYLTTEIIIHSNNVGFTFSKELCAKRLNISDVNRVPTIRIPLLIESLADDIEKEIQELYVKGYQTIFVFKHAKFNILEQELSTVNDGYYLFLNNIEEVQFKVSDIQKKFSIKRSELKVSIQENGQEKTEWYLINSLWNKSVQLAFKLDGYGQIVPCEKDEAVFHCYLPTLEATGYPFKINCDFSTDPSRKHLTWDKQTEMGLRSAAQQLFVVMKELALGENEELLLIFSLIKQKLAFSKFSNCVSDEITKLVKKEKWILLFNGEFISASEYKKKPRFLETSEFLWLRNNSSLKQITPVASLKQNNYFNEFIETYASGYYGIDDWIEVLSEASFVQEADSSLIGKLYGELLKAMRSKELINHASYSLENCYVKDDNEELLIWGSNKNALYSKSFINEFLNKLSINDTRWIDETYKTKFSKEKESQKTTFTDNNTFRTPTNEFASILPKKKKMTISKWRAAEYQCIEFEVLQGNIAKDVSKQNLGYDVHSKTKQGEVRYIEVKSISNRNSEISMTNNEFTAAHQYGENYYLCIIYQQDDKLILEYIRNPLQHLQLEKRVRQWEWICDDYQGSCFEVDVD